MKLGTEYCLENTEKLWFFISVHTPYQASQIQNYAVFLSQKTPGRHGEQEAADVAKEINYTIKRTWLS